MSDTRANIPSVVERTRPVKAGAPVVAAHFLGQTAVFVLGEGALVLAPRAGEPRSVPVHGGAILATAADAERIVTGGDDGKVVATAADGTTRTLVSDAKARWIDRVAAGPDGAVAWATGKTASVQTRKGERSIDLPSSAGADLEARYRPQGVDRPAVGQHSGSPDGGTACWGHKPPPSSRSSARHSTSASLALVSVVRSRVAAVG